MNHTAVSLGRLELISSYFAFSCQESVSSGLGHRRFCEIVYKLSPSFGRENGRALSTINGATERMCLQRSLTGKSRGGRVMKCFAGQIHR